MAFCKGAMHAIRKIWDSITPVLEDIIEEITKYTKLIKDLEQSPAVEAIVKLIPAGSKIEGWLNTALDEINGAAQEGKTLAEKISEWLAEADTEPARNAKVFKLASVATKAADIETGEAAKPESFYDSAVQLHVIVDKG